MCYGVPYHIPGKKQCDYQNSWYVCLVCGMHLGRKKNEYIKCSVCSGRLVDYICSKCGADYKKAFSFPVDFDSIP